MIGGPGSAPLTDRGSGRGLRQEVREFLAAEVASGLWRPMCDSHMLAHSPDFSRRLAERGWIGMAFPRRFGGHDRTAVERLVVLEELIAAGAPVAAHWIADRQTGPLLLRYGTEKQRARFLPAIARGECYFSIGLSESDSGSDLGSLRTRAARVANGWRVSGTKIWTSHAQHNHYFIVLCRSEARGDDRHSGFSQMIIDLHDPAVVIRPIRLLDGSPHFNEVVLGDVFVPDEMVVGTPGNGWAQVMSELAFERGGPERFLSTFPLFTELVRLAAVDGRGAVIIGELAAQVSTLRELSRSIAIAVDAGESPDVAAALVKDVGTRFESQVISAVRELFDREPRPEPGDRLAQLLAGAVMAAPGFTLRGGTTEILQGIVARHLVSR